MGHKTQFSGANRGFECLRDQLLPKRDRNVLLLVMNAPLRKAVTHALFLNHCYVNNGIDDEDFIVTDPLFLDSSMAHLLDREAPATPILLVTVGDQQKDLVLTPKYAVYDVIRVSSLKKGVAVRELLDWFTQPKANCLTRGCSLEFGSGRWACHSRAASL